MNLWSRTRSHSCRSGSCAGNWLATWGARVGCPPPPLLAVARPAREITFNVIYLRYDVDVRHASLLLSPEEKTPKRKLSFSVSCMSIDSRGSFRGEGCGHGWLVGECKEKEFIWGPIPGHPLSAGRRCCAQPARPQLDRAKESTGE